MARQKVFWILVVMADSSRNLSNGLGLRPPRALPCPLSPRLTVWQVISAGAVIRVAGLSESLRPQTGYWGEKGRPGRVAPPNRER